VEKEWLRRKNGGLGKGIFWKKRARFRVQNRHRLIGIRRFQGRKKAASYLNQEFPFSKKGASFSEFSLFFCQKEHLIFAQRKTAMEGRKRLGRAKKFLGWRQAVSGF
jgi:hypothetical protein